MTPVLARRILACPTLPSLPAVALEVLRLCDADDVDLGRIAAAVAQDPALAARLLRAGNSASFATRRRVTTLSHAIALVGTRTTLSMVLSFSLLRRRRAADRRGFDHAAFWRRSLFAALAGRALAELGGLEPEEAFLACLLQDVGMLVLDELFPADYGQVHLSAEGDHDTVASLERELLEVDHVEAGHLLTGRWNLPELFQAAVLASHASPRAGGAGGEPGAPDLDRRRLLLEAVHASGPLADVWTAPSARSALRRGLAPGAGLAGLSAERIGEALERMAAAVPEAAGEFEIDLGGPDRVEATLAQAQALLQSRAGTPAEARRGALVLDHPDELAEALEGAVERAGRTGRPLAIALVAGGACERLSPAISGCLRHSDLLGPRAGGLLAILPDTAPAGAEVVARRIRARCESEGSPAVLGLAALAPGDGPAAVLAAAEAALAAARPGSSGAADPKGEA